jgi:diacylglycerol kinase family enzyme
LPALLIASLLGRTRHSDVESVSGRELTIRTTSRRVQVAVDGEIAEMTQPLRFRARPGGLRVVVPAS